MLYKDGEPYKLTQGQIDQINKFFGKLPIRVVYPDERIKPSRSKHNKMPDKPSSISFPFKAICKTKTGTEEWRYAENTIIDGEGRTKYLPINFRFTGSAVLTENDIELIWFLLRKCPYTKDGDNWNEKNPKIQFENLVKKADDKVEVEERLATFKALIYSSHVGLPEEKLRDVAKALFINGVDDLTWNQVKIQIENRVMVDRRNGIKNFLQMIDSESVLIVRVNIQKAIDRNLIKFIPSKKEWVWLDLDGKRTDLIIKVVHNVKPLDAIYNNYVGDSFFKEAIQSALGIKELENA